MSDRSVTIRLGTEGKAQVKSDFDDIASSGDASAKRLVQSYDRAGDDIEKALARRDAAAAKIQAMMPSGVQSTIMANVGTSARGGYRDAGAGTGDSADHASATEYTALLAEQERQVEAVRAAIDPLYVAQKRYDDEVRSAGGLLRQGAISESEHAAAIGKSEKELAAAKRALEGHSNALGFNRNQFIIAESGVHRFVDSILAGQSPMKAFFMQAGDIGNVLSMDDGGVAGGLAKVRALFNPLTLAVIGTTAALAIGTAAWLSYANAQDHEAALAQGAAAVIGLTGQALEDSARKAASAGNIGVGAAREIQTGYVTMGGIGGNVLAGLTALTTDFAKATGQDAKAAQQQLGAAFQDPVKGAEELTKRYGTLTQAQIDHIQELVQQNDLYGAQAALLQGLQPQFDGAAEHANALARAWHFIATEASGAWDWMGKAIDRAMGGGTLVEQIADLQSQRQQLLASNANGLVPDVDRQIADLKAKLKAEQDKENTAGARSRAVGAMGLVDGITGDDALGKLKAGQAQIAAVVNDTANKAGLSADQLKRARAALDDYTHAVQSYLPEGEKQVRISQLDAQMAATKDPAKKAALATQKSEIEQSGKLVSSTQALAIATANGDKARAEATGHGDKHAQTLAREADAQELSARAALAVAAAYLESAGAGAQAEARRKAITDATKKGADVDAEVRRQIALSAAETIATSAKSVSDMRLETAARTGVNLQVSNGALAVGLMNQALGDEAALRPLLKVQALAQGDALAQLTAVVEAYRKALAEAHAEEAHGQALQSLDALRHRLEDAKLSVQYAGDQTGAGDRARAELAANREADTNGNSVDDRRKLVAGGVAAADAELDARRAQAIAEMRNAQRDTSEQARLQLATIGKSAQTQQLMIDRLQAEQRLRAAGVDLASAEARAVLDGVDAEDAMKDKLALVQSSMAEIQDLGSRFVDDLTNPDGSGIKGLLRDIEQEFIKLAAINPLKNLLTGGNAPTLGSVGGVLGKLFGGGASLGSLSSPALNIGGGTGLSSGLSSTIDFGSTIPQFAAGSEYTPGGISWVGENGPEMVRMPMGSKVTNAADTRRLMTAANDRGGDSHYYDLRGAVVYEDLMRKLQAGNDAAAARGAAGGNQLAKRDLARTARQKLGTRN